MRYTTIIDISEYESLYKNLNVRLVYLHLVLKSGYQDINKDWCRISIRALAEQTGTTISACRNALKQLQKAKMIRYKGGWILVRKLVTAKPPSTRKQ